MSGVGAWFDGRVAELLRDNDQLLERILGAREAGEGVFHRLVPRCRLRPRTSASIFRSAIERLFIQKPQSGWTHLMRFEPMILIATSIRRATSSGVSTVFALISI